MSRDELNASQLAELAALDRILAREPVDEEHLELAALVDSVRAGAPRIDPDFATRLDARMIAARAPARWRLRAARLRPARPAMRRLAVTSGGLVAAAVAFTIVISSGVLGGATHPTPRPFSGVRTPAASKTAPPRNGLGSLVNGVTARGPTATTSGPGVSSPASPAATPAPAARAPRLVQQGSTLTLASQPAAMQDVANRIVADTEQAGGVVERSSVNIQGSTSYAHFNLQVPSGHLAALIGMLSGLASVRALNQSSLDITNNYDREQALLADNLAERAALRKQLAAAATLTQETSIRGQLSKLATRIAAEQAQIDRLLGEGHNATLQVDVVPGTGAKHANAVGPLGRAYRDALHALVEILAIALIALAIVLPFALSALVLWWGMTTVRQRARERAMQTA